jgi:hypothetical protein
MSTNDDHEIIDVEAVEITDAASDHLPAVVETTYQHDEPITKWSEEYWASPEVQTIRCRAHKKTGEQCKNAAIKGATVCRFHGGAAKHVKAAARARLENAADLMAKQLLQIALTADSEAVMLSAVSNALDRAGLKAPSEVVLSQGEAKPYETIFDVIGGSPGPEFYSDLRNDGTVGQDTVSPASVATSGYEDLRPEYVSPPAGEQVSSPEGSKSSGDEPPPSPPRNARGHQRRPEPPARHITGDDAIRAANAANRAAGVWDEQLALESRHKRYPRP